MPIHVRPIAISLAVLAFFGLSIVGLFIGQAPFVCCKKAIIGAILVYIAASVAVNIINAVLTHAIIESHTNKRQPGKEQQRVS